MILRSTGWRNRRKLKVRLKRLLFKEQVKGLNDFDLLKKQTLMRLLQ